MVKDFEKQMKKLKETKEKVQKFKEQEGDNEQLQNINDILEKQLENYEEVREMIFEEAKEKIRELITKNRETVLEKSFEELKEAMSDFPQDKQNALKSILKEFEELKETEQRFENQFTGKGYLDEYMSEMEEIIRSMTETLYENFGITSD